MTNTQRQQWWWLVPLLLLVTWLGARGLTADALWYDEERSVYDAGGSVDGPLTMPQVWERVATRNPWHTPGYFMLLNRWGSLTGFTPFAGRTLSLLVGTLAVAMVYRAGTTLFSARVGRYAALILGASAFFSIYLHELRLYTLYALFTSMIIHLYWRFMQGKATPHEQLGFMLSVVALLYTHYFASLTVAGVGVYHVLFAPKHPWLRWWRIVGLMGIAGLLFLPWFQNVWGVVSDVTSSGSQNTMLIPNDEILRLTVFALANGVLFLLLPLGWVLRNLRQSAALRLVAVVALTMLLLALLVNAITEVIPNIRYLMALWPLTALLLAYGVDQMRRVRVLPVIFLAAWLVVGVFNSVQPGFTARLYGQVFDDFFRPYLPWDDLVATISANHQQGDAVAFSAPRHAWTVGSVFQYYMFSLTDHYTMLNWLPGDEDDYGGQAVRFIDAHQRVWLGEEHNGEPDFRLTQFRTVLDREGFTNCGRLFTTDSLSLDLYARIDVCCSPPDDPVAETRVRFGDGVRLIYASPIPAEGAETLELTLAWWQSDDVPINTYSTALHVVDDAGNITAQADKGLPFDRFACQPVQLTLPEQPGEYSIRLTVYDWSTGERLAVEGDPVIGQVDVP